MTEIADQGKAVESIECHAKKFGISFVGMGNYERF